MLTALIQNIKGTANPKEAAAGLVNGGAAELDQLTHDPVAIGRLAIRRSLWALEGMAPLTPLADSNLDEFNRKAPNAVAGHSRIARWAFKPGWRSMSDLKKRAYCARWRSEK